MAKSLSELEKEITELKEQNLLIVGCLVQSFTLFSNITSYDGESDANEIRKEMNEYFNRLMKLIEKRAGAKNG